MAEISQEAVDDVVSFEVSSRAYYVRHYQHPEWPGGFSGVTIGIGYDLGYATLQKLHADWDGRLPPDMIRVMERCLGVRGEAARDLERAVRQAIDVPWDAATAVFLERDVPEWTARVCRDIPGADRLPPDCLGALVSCAYNRGDSFAAQGDRFREMRAIRLAVISGHPERVPALLRSMKRLWPNVAGLRHRRDVEAALFEKGLKAPVQAVAPSSSATPVPLPPPRPIIVKDSPAAALPVPTAGAQEHGAAIATASAGGAAANHAASSGADLKTIIAIGIAVAVAAVVAWLVVRQVRASQPQTARQKG